MGVCDHLFVYGTLMPSARTLLGAVERTRLMSEAEHLGSGDVAGQLVDLGSYPGLVVSSSADRLVHGDVFRLQDPQATFSWLDAYEGLEPDAAVSEYRRVTLTVRWRKPDRMTLSAWAYIMEEVPLNAQLIDATRWDGG
ncbi:MAG: gamma-glutamylcyclotransferase family protein [Pseudomonadota bacterium]